MRKLSIFHCSISVLLRWAESPRLRPTLKEPVLVTTIASQTKSPVCLPTTKEDWVSIIEDVIERAQFEPTDVGLINLAEAAMKRYSNPEPGRIMVHCELALLEHYKRQKRATPPFNYIAVSKLSCEPCRLYIQAFNNSLHTTFCTAGGHGKYYYPWGAPSLGGTRFLNDLADSMSRGICERWAAMGNGKFRSYSGSLLGSLEDFGVEESCPTYPEDAIDNTPHQTGLPHII